MNPKPITILADANEDYRSAPSDLPSLQGYWLWLARAVWLLIALLCVGLFVLGTVAQYDRFREPCSAVPLEFQHYCWPTENALNQLGMTWDDLANFYVPIATVAALPLILIGCLVFWRKTGNVLGLLFSLALVAAGSGGINIDLIEDLFYAFPNLSIPVACLFFLSNGAHMIFMCLFPDGRFVPRWTRWLLILWAGSFLAIAISLSRYHVFSLGNSPWMNSLTLILIPVLNIAAIYAMIFRYRHSARPLQREQIKWIIVGTFVAVIFKLGFNIVRPFWQPGFFDLFMLMIYSPLYYLAVLFSAVCYGISISRYRLWDVDYLINRTLVYSLLTASIIGIYVLAVGALGTVMQSNVNWLVSILATGLIAVLVQPLRDRLQRGVNRLMYGERDDPVSVLSRLGQRLEGTLAPDAVLPSLVETVAQTLKLPYVAIERRTKERLMPQPTTDSSSIGIFSPTISYGQPQSDVIRFPLVHQSETIGELLVAPRASGEAFSPMDRHLLENIARQAGMAVHAVSLTNELQRARQRLVTAVEEERRRLRRDLHDGLGPALASQGLKLAAAKQLLKRDPDSVESLLDQVMTQNQETVGDVRRLVYGLRPPVLDERGLAEAIRDHVLHGQDDGLQVEVGELPVDLQSLPAAIEVAAYRIALEALTNIIRHARAKHCTIRFTTTGNGHTNVLQVEVADNGVGLPRDLRAGVGLRSMRERAEELGGTLTVEPMPRGGTRVVAMLPLGADANSRDFDQIASADYR